MPAIGSSTVTRRRSEVRALAGADLELGCAHAGCPIGGVARRRLSSSDGEQLVEDRHPHEQSGGDLLGDQRLGRIDHLAGELDAAVDRARVHQQLAGAEPPRVDLEVGRVLANRGNEALTHSLVLEAQGVDDIGLTKAVE